MDFIESLRIDKGNLSASMRKIPSKLYEYGLAEIEMIKKIERIEEEIKEYISNQKTIIRSKYRRSKIKLTPTEVSDAVNALSVEEDSELKILYKRLRKYKHLGRIAKLRLNCLKDKRDMIVNISHNDREEHRTKTKV